MQVYSGKSAGAQPERNQGMQVVLECLQGKTITSDIQSKIGNANLKTEIFKDISELLAVLGHPALLSVIFHEQNLQDIIVCAFKQHLLSSSGKPSSEGSSFPEVNCDTKQSEGTQPVDADTQDKASELYEKEEKYRIN